MPYIPGAAKLGTATGPYIYTSTRQRNCCSSASRCVRASSSARPRDCCIRAGPRPGARGPGGRRFQWLYERLEAAPGRWVLPEGRGSCAQLQGCEPLPARRRPVIGQRPRRGSKGRAMRIHADPSRKPIATQIERNRACQQHRIGAARPRAAERQAPTARQASAPRRSKRGAPGLAHARARKSAGGGQHERRAAAGGAAGPAAGDAAV